MRFAERGVRVCWGRVWAPSKMRLRRGEITGGTVPGWDDTRARHSTVYTGTAIGISFVILNILKVQQARPADSTDAGEALQPKVHKVQTGLQDCKSLPQLTTL